MEKKIKVIPPKKNRRTCYRCVYYEKIGSKCGQLDDCYGCDLYCRESRPQCSCYTIDDGQPCKYFEREKGVLLKTKVCGRLIKRGE